MQTRPHRKYEEGKDALKYDKQEPKGRRRGKGTGRRTQLDAEAHLLKSFNSRLRQQCLIRFLLHFQVSPHLIYFSPQSVECAHHCHSSFRTHARQQSTEKLAALWFQNVVVVVVDGICGESFSKTTSDS